MPRKIGSSHVDDTTAFAARLRSAREAAGLSQRQLAFSGCSPAYISRIEAGERLPSLQLIRELARRLGVSEAWLATGKEVDDPLVEADAALRFGDFEQARELFAGVLAADPSAAERARANAGLGQLAFLEGEIGEAIALLEAARTLSKTAAVGTNAETLGRAYAIAGDSERALALFQEQLAAAEETGDAIERLRFAVLLANVYIDMTRFDDATDVLARVIRELGDLSDPLSLARVYWTQSRLHAARGQTELATRYAHRALERIELTDDLRNIARAYRLLGFMELEAGRPADALGTLRRGESLLGPSGDRRERASFQLERARALVELGDLEEAASLAMATSAEFGAEGHPLDLGRSFATLARAFHERHELARAGELYELAIELLEQRPNPHLAQACANFGELLEQEGRRDEALEVYKRAAQAQARLGRFSSTQ